MAEAEHTLIAGIIFVDPVTVLAAHSRVAVTTELAHPVKSGAEIGAGVDHLAKLSLHGTFNLCQPSVDRDELDVEAAVPSGTRLLPSTILLQLQIGLRVVSVVRHLAWRRVGALAAVVFRRRAVVSTLRRRRVRASESLSSLG
jgi:hypothetical protein